MSGEVIELRTFESSSRPAFEALKSAPGLLGMYLGAPLEAPDTQVLLLRWGSSAAAMSSSASDSVEDAEKYTFSARFPHVKGSALAALSTPCTEVVTAYGAEAAFLGQTETFMDLVDAGSSAEADGYHGYFVAGESLADVRKAGADGEPGKAVLFALGWDSKEAHLQAKSKPGPISDNIHMIRSGRKDISLYHVNFTKLQ